MADHAECGEKDRGAEVMPGLPDFAPDEPSEDGLLLIGQWLAARAGLSELETGVILRFLGKFEVRDNRFSKFVVLLSLFTLLGYTAAMFVFSWFGRTMPDSLTYSFFGAFSVELSALAWLTRGGKKKQDRGQKVDENY